MDIFSLVFKDRRVGKKWAMEEIPYNVHMKPINHLVKNKNVKCPLHSFLIFEKGLVERFIQTFKGVAHTMITAKDNLQHKIANFLLFCTKAVHTAIIVVPGLSYIIRRLNPEVPEYIHGKKKEAVKNGLQIDKYNGNLNLIENVFARNYRHNL